MFTLHKNWCRVEEATWQNHLHPPKRLPTSTWTRRSLCQWALCIIEEMGRKTLRARSANAKKSHEQMETTAKQSRAIYHAFARFCHFNWTLLLFDEFVRDFIPLSIYDITVGVPACDTGFLHEEWPGSPKLIFWKKNASCNQPSWCTNVSAPSTWWGKPSTTKNQRSKKKIQRKIWPFTKWKWISRGDRQLICKFYLETELQSRNVWTNSNLLQKTWALKRTKKITSFATKQETKTEDDKMFSFSQSIFCRKIAERKSIERHFLYELGSEAIRPSMIYAILFLLADLRKRIIQIWEKSKRSVLKKNDVRKTNWSKMTTPE